MSNRLAGYEETKMDFDLSEEQRLLKESVDGLLTDAYDFEQRKKYMKEKGGWSKAVWGKLAEQGLLGLPFAEADGGFGAGGGETMVWMGEPGRAGRRLPAVRGSGWRLRRRRRRDHDRDGSARQGDGDRALSRHRGDIRR